ncbi:unnamed protein product [Ixodes hexagonus]
MEFYGNNKAPFPIFLHQGWLANPKRQVGFLKFIDWLLAKDDVFFVTLTEVIKFMQSPKPLSRYREYKCYKDIVPSTMCTRPVQCVYKRVKIAGVIRDRWTRLRQIAVFQHSFQERLPQTPLVENNNRTDEPPVGPQKTDSKDLKLDAIKLRHIASSAKVGQLRRESDPSRDGQANVDVSRNHAAIRDPHRARTAKTLFSVVIFFMICWFPLYTLNCVKAFCVHCDPPQWVFDSLIVLSHLNSALNPFLYAYRMKDFREALQRLLKCKHPAPLSDVRTLCHRNGRSPDNHIVEDLHERAAVMVTTTPAL